MEVAKQEQEEIETCSVIAMVHLDHTCKDIRTAGKSTQLHPASKPLQLFQKFQQNMEAMTISPSPPPCQAPTVENIWSQIENIWSPSTNLLPVQQEVNHSIRRILHMNFLGEFSHPVLILEPVTFRIWSLGSSDPMLI